MSFTGSASVSCEGTSACSSTEVSLSGDLRCGGDACSTAVAAFSGEEHAITCSGDFACELAFFEFEAEPGLKSGALWSRCRFMEMS